MIRHYAADWLRGARRFACILYPYLQEDAEEKKAQTFVLLGLGDLRMPAMRASGDAEAIPDGLTGIDPAELGDDDDDFLRDLLGEARTASDGPAHGRRPPRRQEAGPHRPATASSASRCEYGELLRALGLNLTDERDHGPLLSRTRLAAPGPLSDAQGPAGEGAARRGLRDVGYRPTIWTTSTCSVR